MRQKNQFFISNQSIHPGVIRTALQISGVFSCHLKSRLEYFEACADKTRDSLANGGGP